MKITFSCILFLIASGLITSGCADKVTGTSPAPVPDSVMIELLIEMHLTEARIEMHNEPMLETRDSIFVQYGITPATFEAAMDYYTENPEAYLKIYTEALDKISDERYMPAQ